MIGRRGFITGLVLFAVAPSTIAQEPSRCLNPAYRCVLEYGRDTAALGRALADNIDGRIIEIPAGTYR